MNNYLPNEIVELIISFNIEFENIRKIYKIFSFYEYNKFNNHYTHFSNCLKKLNVKIECKKCIICNNFFIIEDMDIVDDIPNCYNCYLYHAFYDF